jgi:hypothetical protein
MKNTTKWNLTLVTGVIFSSRQAAGRDLNTDGRGSLYGPTPTTTAIKDVAYVRCRRALV